MCLFSLLSQVSYVLVKYTSWKIYVELLTELSVLRLSEPEKVIEKTLCKEFVVVAGLVAVWTQLLDWFSLIL